MFAANTFVIRHVESQGPLGGPALVGEIDGRPAAAIAMDDGRVIADPFQETASLVAQLRMRARGLRSYERMPSLRERLRAGVRVQRAQPAGC
jgi:hypothetical protein